MSEASKINAESFIRRLGNDIRVETFCMVADLILDNKLGRMVETGCYRGDPSQGSSTEIFAMLAMQLKHGGHLKCYLDSYELNPAHAIIARERLAAVDLARWARIHDGDSVTLLSLRLEYIDFAYFDSYDHNPDNPLESQMHELAEIGAAFGKFSDKCAVLLDDNGGPDEGKTFLGTRFLLMRGFKLVHDGYQRLLTRGI